MLKTNCPLLKRFGIFKMDTICSNSKYALSFTAGYEYTYPLNNFVDLGLKKEPKILTFRKPKMCPMYTADLVEFLRPEMTGNLTSSQSPFFISVGMIGSDHVISKCGCS